MSQNPNFNPYNPNPADPNQNPGTSYGTPPPPPGQGSNPNYNPYAPNPPTPGPGSNPNYNPYAPNPPTPGPGSNPNYDPYNPYASNQYEQTVLSPGPSPNYTVYPQGPSVPPAPPPTAPAVPPKRGSAGKIILVVGLVVLLILAGIVFAVVNNNNTQTNNANATATAQTIQERGTAQAHVTATAQAFATSTAIASTYPFSANVKLTDSLTDNSGGFQWQTSDFCKFSGSAYHVIDNQTNTYAPCLALNTDFSDFTFQVEMSISKGDGGGLIFRGDSSKSKYYRLAVFKDATYAIYIYVDNTGTNARTLKQGTITQTLNDTNTIGVVARGSSISLYVNQAEVVTIQDSTYSHGQIGLNAVNLTTPVDVIFTNVKVWQL